MPIEITMPALSPTMLDGKIVKWVEKEGTKLTPSTVIAEIETDKATMELEAQTRGILAKILIPSSDNKVEVGSLIAVVAKNEEDLKNVDEFIKNFEAKSQTSLELAKEEQKVEIPEPKVENITNEEKNQEASRVFISPLAKKIASEANVDFSKIQGTGPYGRIVKNDIEEFLKSESYKSSGVISRNSNKFIRKPISQMRNVIALRLVESKQKVPHFYLTFDVEMDSLFELREQFNHFAEIDKEGKPNYKISVNDLIIKALSLALKKFPDINASWNETEIIQYNNIDISVAVAIEGGLITPIIHNADQKDIKSISSEVKSLAKKAKEGKLQPKEYQGGGFTISNLGAFDHISKFISIINMPQSAILAVPSTIEKPAAKHGKIEIRKICSMTLSADHRIIDGLRAAEFTKYLKEILERPVSLFI